MTWPTHPTVGALLTLSGLLAALVALLLSWERWWIQYPVIWHAVAVAGLLIGLDDAVSHALGWPTPLDVAWKLAGPAASAVVFVVGVLGVLAVSSGTGKKREDHQ